MSATIQTTTPPSLSQPPKRKRKRRDSAQEGSKKKSKSSKATTGTSSGKKARTQKKATAAGDPKDGTAASIQSPAVATVAARQQHSTITPADDPKATKERNYQTAITCPNNNPFEQSPFRNHNAEVPPLIPKLVDALRYAYPTQLNTQREAEHYVCITSIVWIYSNCCNYLKWFCTSRHTRFSDRGISKRSRHS